VKFKTVLGLILSVGLVAWIVSKYELSDALAQLEHANLSYLAPLPVLFAFDYITRAIRWRTLFDVDVRPRTGTLLRALMVSYLMNNILPARAGDIARIYLLGRRTEISKSIILATLLVEKVGDLIVTGCLLSAVLIVLPANEWIRAAGYGTFVISLVGALILFLVPVLSKHTHEWIKRYFGFLPQALYQHLLAFITNVSGGVRDGIRLPGLLRFAAYSIVIWAMEVTIMLSIARSLGIQAGLMPLLFVMLAITVGTMIPSSPGYIGTFEYFALSALALIGITGTTALGFTLLYHAIVLIGTSLGGVVFVILPGREQILLLLNKNRAERNKAGLEDADGISKS